MTVITSVCATMTLIWTMTRSLQGRQRSDRISLDKAARQSNRGTPFLSAGIAREACYSQDYSA
jgi:hypothetical protein